MPRNRLTTYAWTVLAACVAASLWGGVARAAGWGGDRLAGAAALLLVAGLVGWVFGALGQGRPARSSAVFALVFAVGDAVLGNLPELVAAVDWDAPVPRALLVATRLAVSLLTLAALTLTAHRAGGGAAVSRQGEGTIRRLAAASLAGTLLIGTSGAVTTLDVFPSATTLHPLIAVVVSLVLLQLIDAVRKRRPGASATPQARRHANRLNLLVFAQLGLGSLNIVLHSPLVMQLLHLLLAQALWVVLILTCAERLAAAPDV